MKTVSQEAGHQNGKEAAHSRRGRGPKLNDCHVMLSGRFLVVSFVSLSLLSFGAGIVFRYAVLGGQQPGAEDSNASVVDILRALSISFGPASSSSSSPPKKRQSRPLDLPKVVLPSDKKVPESMYTCKLFNTTAMLTETGGSGGYGYPFWVLSTKRSAEAIDEENGTCSRFFEAFADGGSMQTAAAAQPPGAAASDDARDSEDDDDDDDDSSDDEDGDDDEDDAEEHFAPMGQHLLVDIKNVDASFLSSEESLAHAMVGLVKEGGLTMLSYHCHSLDDQWMGGVSCLGVLLESHVSFHTWPRHGVVSLDVFTCGTTPLMPLLPYIEKLFGVPVGGEDEGEGNDRQLFDRPHAKWAHKYRGFDPDYERSNPETVDFDTYTAGWMGFDYKKQVASEQTNFQTIDIVDVINPRYRTLEMYQRSLTKDGSYESEHPELFQPDRLVYLDKVTQSSRYGDAAYHETLVHPAMFAHDGPRRVAIIGGGEGATLREVLRHRTVEKVVMIEIDEMMVNISREYLPEWSDCSNIVGSAASCFDDPRADVYYEDAVAWFVDRFGDDVKYDPSDQFDVVIMDALDPSSATEFSDILYNNRKLVTAISNAMADNAIMISQVGESEEQDEPPTEYTRVSTLETAFMPMLAENGFQRILGFEDMHGGFMAVWGYIIAFRDAAWSSEKWFGNQAAIDLRLRKRMLPTVSGESSLRYFDGATMRSIAFTSPCGASAFCRKDFTPPFCDLGHGFDPNKGNVPISSFEVHSSSSTKGSGNGLFSKVAIPKGSYVAIEEGVHSMLVLPETQRLINDMMSKQATIADRWDRLGQYMVENGYASDAHGNVSYSLDTSALAFINRHAGCSNSGGTYNIGTRFIVTEEDILAEAASNSSHTPTEAFSKLLYERDVYNPLIDRNVFMFQKAGDVAIVDINPGDEICLNSSPLDENINGGSAQHYEQ